MRFFFGLVIVVVLVFMSSCSPRVTEGASENNPSTDYKEDVLIIGLSQIEPDNAEVLGQIEVDESGFKVDFCYDSIIVKAKADVRIMGGCTQNN